MPEKSAPRTLYLNAASHGLPDEAVRRRMKDYLARESDAGPHRAALEAAEELEAVRGKAAALIGARADETALATTTTRAWGMAVAALPLKGRRILVAPHEWVSNIAILQRLDAGPGMTIDVLPLAPDGDLDTEALRGSIGEDVAAICVPMVSSLTGRRYPVEKIGAMARPDHCFYVVDAAQALGQTPVDVTRIGCDMLAATARKWLRAPRGTALLYVSSRTLERLKPVPFPDTGLLWRPDSLDFADAAAAARFETFDANAALGLGLGAAIDIALKETVPAVSKRLLALANHVRARAREAGIALFSPGKAQSAITALRLPQALAESLPARLDAARIVVKFPAPRDEPLAPAPPDGDTLLRVSPHVYNSREDIDALFSHIGQAR